MRTIHLIAFSAVLLLTCCNNKEGALSIAGKSSSSIENSEKSLNTTKNAFGTDDDQKNLVVLNNVQYKVNLISGLEFIRIRGEKPDQSDVEALKKETVMFLEIWSNEGVKSILESKRLTMNADDAVSYLMGDISADITLIQGKKEFTSNAVLYDGNLTGANKIRVFFFVQDLDQSKLTTIKYYDRLFGAGMINLKQKVTKSV